MEIHRTDEERLDALKNWWSENGRNIVVGVVLGIGAVSGWVVWTEYEQGQAEAASIVFQEARTAAAAGDHQALRAAADVLLSEHSDHDYAAAAALLLAKSDVEQGRFEAARDHLEWVIDHAEFPELRDLGRLRLAETLFAAGAFDEAAQLLGEKGAGPFAAASDDLLGDLHPARGEPDKAREAWERAAAGLSRSPLSREQITLKLNDLGQLNTPVQP